MVHEYIGSKITIISRNDKRYEGILHSIDVDKSTITLKDVRYFEDGPNGAPGTASSTVFEMIVFRGSDITDLAVCQPEMDDNHEFSGDPAMPTVNREAEVHSNQTRDAANNSMTQKRQQQKKPLETGSGNSRNSQRTGYNNTTASGGKRMNNNNQGGAKDYTRNRQRNGGYSTRSYRGGSNNYNGGGHQRSFVVGELRPRINQALKAELETEFDFSEQNKKFEKTFNEGLSSVHTEQGINFVSYVPGQDDQLGIIKSGIGGSGFSDINGGSIDIGQSKKLTVGGYNKGSGFFDSISCETLDPERSKKSQGLSDPQAKAMREKQKLIDKETFGDSATKPHSGSYNRGINNRRGGGGHRGAYRTNNRFNHREA